MLRKNVIINEFKWSSFSVFRFLFLLSTILTKPRLSFDNMLLDTWQMEPLCLTESVLTHNHFSIGWSSTITILRLKSFIIPLSFFLVLFLFVGLAWKMAFQLSFKDLSRHIDAIIKLLSQKHFR